MASAPGKVFDRVSSATVSSCLAVVAVGTNGTAIMAALPTMRADLGLSSTEVGWAVNAYLIASAACIILGGRAADRAGPRNVAIFGLVLFASASAIIAVAGSAAWLLTGRALQGLGAAFAVPGTLAAVGAASAPAGRASAIGAWAGCLMLGFSVGPLMGGVLTHYLGWRAVFWCVAALVLAATTGLMRAMSLRVAGVGVFDRFDWAGFLLLAAAMVSATFALHALPHALGDPLALAAPLVIAGGMLAVFVRTERRASDPIVPLPAFRSRDFVMALVVSAIPMGCILPLLLYFNLDAQSPSGLSLTPVGAGLFLLPMSAGLLLCALAAPRVIAALGRRRAITGAMLLITAASAVILAAGQAVIPLLGSLFLVGAGLALPYATGPRLALQELPAGQGGQGAGLVNACTFLGGSIGVTGGGIAYALGGLPWVMALIGAVGLAGAVAAWRMPEVRRANGPQTARSLHSGP